MDLSINEGTLVVTGGPGDSVQTAIVIKKIPKGLSVAAVEQLILEQRYGRRGEAWALAGQDLMKIAARTYDVFHVVLSDAAEKALYFDVTDWLRDVVARRAIPQ